MPPKGTTKRPREQDDPAQGNLLQMFSQQVPKRRVIPVREDFVALDGYSAECDEWSKTDAATGEPAWKSMAGGEKAGYHYFLTVQAKARGMVNVQRLRNAALWHSLKAFDALVAQDDLESPDKRKPIAQLTSEAVTQGMAKANASEGSEGPSEGSCNESKVDRQTLRAESRLLTNGLPL